MSKNRFRPYSGISILLAIMVLTVGSASAQVYTVAGDFGTRVAGPDTPFTINLTMSPSDTDISGFSFKVAYDNTQLTLESVTDNTGQPSAGVEYTIGTEQAITGVPNVNVYVPVIMDTAFSLENPTNLAQLNFRSTPTYSDPNNRVWLHLEDHLFEGLVDGNYESLPTEYQFGQQVPVTLSGFSLE